MDFLRYFALLPGLMLGMLVLSRVLRWCYSLWTVHQERLRDPAHRSAWRILPVLLLHSGPWLLMATGVFAYFMLRTEHAAAWDWFFGGALFSLPLFGFTVYWTFGRIRRAKERAAKR